MPLLLTILGILGAVGFWVWRMRDAADTLHEVADMAGDVMAAARRFGFRRKHNQHPVDAIEDIALAQGSLAVAVTATGPLPTQETRGAQMTALRKHLRLNAQTGDEMFAMANWFINECNGAEAAVSRLGKRLLRLGGEATLDTTLQIVNDTATAAGGLSDPEREALGELARLFRRT